MTAEATETREENVGEEELVAKRNSTSVIWKNFSRRDDVMPTSKSKTTDVKSSSS